MTLPTYIDYRRCTYIKYFPDYKFIVFRMADFESLMWPGESVIYQLADVAVVKASERKLRGESGESSAEESVGDYGTLVITNRRLLIVYGGGGGEPADATANMFTVTTRQIVLHGISTDVNSFPKPCMYCQLDNDDGDDGGDEAFMGFGSNSASAYFGGGGGAGAEAEEDIEAADDDSPEDEGGDGDEEEVEGGGDFANDFEELYIVPKSEDKLSEMFDALSKSALENPDEDEDNSDDLEGEEGFYGDYDDGEDDDGDGDGYEELRVGQGEELRVGQGGGLIYDFDKANLNEEQLRNLAHLESVFIGPAGNEKENENGEKKTE